MTFDDIQEMIRKYLSTGAAVVIILVSPATGDAAKPGEPNVTVVPKPGDSGASDSSSSPPSAEPDVGSSPDNTGAAGTDPADGGDESPADEPSEEKPSDSSSSGSDTSGGDTGGGDADASGDVPQPGADVSSEANDSSGGDSSGGGSSSGGDSGGSSSSSDTGGDSSSGGDSSGGGDSGGGDSSSSSSGDAKSESDKGGEEKSGSDSKDDGDKGGDSKESESASTSSQSSSSEPGSSSDSATLDPAAVAPANPAPNNPAPSNPAPSNALPNNPPPAALVPGNAAPNNAPANATPASPAAPRPDGFAASPSSTSSASATAGSGTASASASSGPAAHAPVPAPAGPAVAAVPADADATAAERHGWGTTSRQDDFSGGLDQWSVYTGPGHAGKGQRSPSAVAVKDGALTITGDQSGTSGGLALTPGQRYGRWEARVRTPAADPSYNAVMLLWPDADNFPVGGEIDFMEMTDPARQAAGMFVHHGADNKQVSGEMTIDATQWHTWAVEWTPEAIVGYVDGKEWFRNTDPTTFPPGPMHLCIQLDWFPTGTASPKPSTMEVDWVRQYSLDGTTPKDSIPVNPANAADASKSADGRKPFGEAVRRMFSWG